MATPHLLKKDVISSLVRFVPPSVDICSGAPYLAKYVLSVEAILDDVVPRGKWATSNHPVSLSAYAMYI